MENTAISQLVESVDIDSGELGQEDWPLLAKVAAEVAVGAGEVLRVMGTMGLSIVVASVIRATYMLGLRQGKKRGPGLTFVVAPENPEVCEN